MPLSQSALERGNPPPRRKSCVACARAKRRCNLAHPSCSRCAQRRLPCVYVSERASRGGPGSASDAVARSPRSRTGEWASPPSFDLAASDPMRADFEASTLDFLFLDHLDRIVDGPAPPENQPDLALSSMRTPLSWSPPQARPTFISYVTSQRLQYALDQLLAAPLQMVRDNAVPWCHAQLYRDAMPRSMQDAQACCALYIAKNRTNAASVLRIIEARVADLVATPPPDAAASPLEALARAQALLLYQLMRLFDGDVRSRAAAEQTMPHLEAAAAALAPITAEDPPPHEAAADSGNGCLLPLYPLAGTRAFWEAWIVRESARRTMLVTFLVVVIYRLLRSGSPVLCDKMVHGGARFTASAHLWRAADPVEFAVAWGQRKHFLVPNSGVGDILLEAEPDDIDSYGRIMLTALLGIDEVRGWFLSKGATL